MARSYRKPILGDSYGSPHRKWAKRQAAKTVRRTGELADGKSYRKAFNPYNITDYKCRIDKPNANGKQVLDWRWKTHDEMVREYRKATRK